jgi:hypothetical protein
MFKTITTAAALSLAAMTVTVAADDSNRASTNSGCKVVHLKPGEQAPSGALSSSVTAGGGHVSAQTTGGNSVTVHSGNGSTSSSVTTGSSSGPGGSSTTVTNSDGSCTVYVTPNK